MASTINASTSAGGGIIQTADASGVLTLQTSGTNALSLDANQFATGTVKGNSSGLYQASQYYRLNTALVGANATGAQSLFGVGVTLAASTVYEFEIAFALSKTAGTTSHTISYGYGGTATINNIMDLRQRMDNATGLSAGGSGFPMQFVSTVTAQAGTTSITTAGWFAFAVMKGTVSINAGGTFIPQYTLSAAPGGAYSTVAGSYIKISPISASGSNTNIGTWA